MLYIVSTPIGNLKDITLRAIDTLKNVDLIAAEDTRRTKVLANEYDIKTPTTSYFEHNEKKKAKELLALLKEGKDIALVSDAGTPGINDPGYRIVRQAKENNIPVTVVPGASAVVAALSLSGLPTDRFIFEGFLPVKTGLRKKRLKEVAGERRTVIFYESPHRLLKSLQDIKDVLGDPEVVVVREITKKFEEVKQGSCSALIQDFRKKKPKGEFVVCLNVKG